MGENTIEFTGEYTLQDVIGEVLRRDFMPFEEPCRHKFSFRHRRKMKKMFSANTGMGFEKTSAGISVRKRLIVVLTLVLLMALAGLSAAANFGGSFIGSFGFMKNAAGNTAAVSLDQANDHSFISDIYKLGILPEGYVYDGYHGELDRTFTYYRNETDDLLWMMQYVKAEFAPEYDSRFSGFTETRVGGMSGFYSTMEGYTYLVWDNGEYIFELNGKFPVEDLIKVAESLCIDTNYRMGWFSAENL